MVTHHACTAAVVLDRGAVVEGRGVRAGLAVRAQRPQPHVVILNTARGQHALGGEVHQRVDVHTAPAAEAP